MRISRDEAGGVVAIAGDLDIAAGDELKAALRDCLAAGPGVTVDLSAVEACDAAALQVLWAAQKAAGQAKQPSPLTGISSAIQETAAALGLPLTDRRQ